MKNAKSLYHDHRFPAAAISCAVRWYFKPSSVNMHGDVFGGWIMSHVDIADSIPASQRAAGHVVTIAMNSFTFKQQVFKDDLLNFYARVKKEGKTSITVYVEVFA